MLLEITFLLHDRIGIDLLGNLYQRIMQLFLCLVCVAYNTVPGALN